MNIDDDTIATATADELRALVRTLLAERSGPAAATRPRHHARPQRRYVPGDPRNYCGSRRTTVAEPDWVAAVLDGGAA